MRKWMIGACLALTMFASSGCATIGATMAIEGAAKDQPTRTLLKVAAYPVTVPVDIALLPVEAPVVVCMVAGGGWVPNTMAVK